MMKKSDYFLLLVLFVFSITQAQTTLFFDDFESGSGNWQLVSNDNGGCTASCDFDWVVTNDYTGGTYFFGLIVIPDTPLQTASGITSENGNYLHVNSGGGVSGFAVGEWNSNYFAGSGQQVFTEMSTPINTTGYTNVNFSFYWLDNGGTGKAYYSIDGGTSWLQIGADMNNDLTWSQTTFTNVNFDNQADLRFGFYFEDNGTQIDPPLSIDDVKVEGILTPLGCVSTTTWNGGWDNGIPDNTKLAIINSAYNNGSFSCCELTVTALGLLTINAGEYVNIENDLINNGTIDVLHEGSLVQIDDLSTVTGTGLYNVHKTTTPYVQFDYTYWSSPLNQETVGSVFAANPSDNIFSFDSANFSDRNNGTTYPQIIVGADTFDDDGNDWQSMLGGNALIPGVGYIAMGEMVATYPNTQNVIFSETGINGAFNNGNINVPTTLDLYNFSGQTGFDSFNTNSNLIGNPYPSAIDIHELYLENNTILEGTFYFWTHDTPIASDFGPHVFDFTNDDYATATSDGSVLSYVHTTPNGTDVPRYIASTQGFFVNVLSAGNVLFNNGMRVNGPNNTFKSNDYPQLDRVWLNLTNDSGVFRQLLISFHDNATDNYQNGQDGQRLENGNNTDFYSIIENEERRFVIQNLASFNRQKTVKLGIEIIEIGTYKISVNNTLGIFNSTQDVYLYDYYTTTLHNLSDNPYSFYSEVVDALEDRFELRFTDNILGTDESVLNSINIYPNSSEGLFNIRWNGIQNLKIKVFNIIGKEIILENKIVQQNTNYLLNLSSYSSGVYFVKLDFKENIIIKKIVIK